MSGIPAGKRTRRRTTQWNLFFHYFTFIYAFLSGILLVPLYLHYIPTDIYGVWLASSNVIGWLGLVDPGISGVVMQRTAEAYGRGDHVELGRLLTIGIVLSLGVGLVIVVAGGLLTPYLFPLLNITPAARLAAIEPAYGLTVAGTALLYISYTLTAINQGLQSSLGIGIVFVVIQLAGLALTLWLLHAGLGVLALAWAVVFRGAGMLLGNLAYLVWRLWHDQLRCSLSFSRFGELTKLMTITFFSRTVATFANMDVLLLTRYLGPEWAPVYTLTRKIPDMGRDFLERPVLAFQPATANLSGAGDRDRLRVILIRLFTIILWGIGLAFIGVLLLNETFVRLWVGAQFFAGALINGLIMLQIVLLVFSNSLANVCYALGNLRGNSLAALAQGLITIPLVILGARYQGMAGVVLASIISTLMIACVYYPRVFITLSRISKRELKTYGGEVVNMMAAVAIIALLYPRGVLDHGWWQFALAAISIAVSYIGILFLLSPSFRKEICHFLHRLHIIY